MTGFATPEQINIDPLAQALQPLRDAVSQILGYQVTQGYPQQPNPYPGMANPLEQLYGSGIYGDGSNTGQGPDTYKTDPGTNTGDGITYGGGTTGGGTTDGGDGEPYTYQTQATQATGVSPKEGYNFFNEDDDKDDDKDYTGKYAKGRPNTEGYFKEHLDPATASLDKPGWPGPFTAPFTSGQMSALSGFEQLFDPSPLVTSDQTRSMLEQGMGTGFGYNEPLPFSDTSRSNAFLNNLFGMDKRGQTEGSILVGSPLEQRGPFGNSPMGPGYEPFMSPGAAPLTSGDKTTQSFTPSYQNQATQPDKGVKLSDLGATTPLPAPAPVDPTTVPPAQLNPAGSEFIKNAQAPPAPWDPNMNLAQRIASAPELQVPGPNADPTKLTSGPTFLPNSSYLNPGENMAASYGQWSAMNPGAGYEEYLATVGQTDNVQVTGRQSGGPLDPNAVNIVGEAGPEAIVGNQVIPNAQMGDLFKNTSAFAPPARTSAQDPGVTHGGEPYIPPGGFVLGDKTGGGEGGSGGSVISENQTSAFTPPGTTGGNELVNKMLPQVAQSWSSALVPQRFDTTDMFKTAESVFQTDLERGMAGAKEEMSRYGLNPGASDRTERMQRTAGDIANRHRLGLQGIGMQAFEGAENRRLGALGLSPGMGQFGNIPFQNQLAGLPYMMQNEQLPFQESMQAVNQVFEPAAQRKYGTMSMLPQFSNLPFEQAQNMWDVNSQAQGVADTDIQRQMGNYFQGQGGIFNDILSLLSGTPQTNTMMGPSSLSQLSSGVGGAASLYSGLKGG